MVGFMQHCIFGPGSIDLLEQGVYLAIEYIRVLALVSFDADESVVYGDKLLCYVITIEVNLFTEEDNIVLKLVLKGSAIVLMVW
jgi:hypothetical protein